MRITNLTLSLALSLSALAAGACKDSSSGGAPSDSSPAASASEDLKLDAAIRCQNYASAAVFRARTQYLRHVDAEAGPTPESKNIYVGTVNPGAHCAPLAEALAAKPALKELDDAIAAYRAALEAATPVIDDAHSYYDQKRHLDDGLAKGKELHPKLMASFRAFADADKALGTIVKSRNRARKEAQLATIADDPKQRGRYVRGHLLLVAEDLIEIGLASTFEEIDAAAFEAKLEELDKNVAELAKLGDEAGGSFFKSKADYYLRAALAISRRIREKTPYTERERNDLERGMGKNVEGSIPQLLDTYNALIDEANRIRS